MVAMHHVILNPSTAIWSWTKNFHSLAVASQETLGGAAPVAAPVRLRSIRAYYLLQSAAAVQISWPERRLVHDVEYRTSFNAVFGEDFLPEGLSAEN